MEMLLPLNFIELWLKYFLTIKRWQIITANFRLQTSQGTWQASNLEMREHKIASVRSSLRRLDPIYADAKF